MVTYSIMIYFTPGFEALESDVEGYINTMMAELNEGYANSGIPMQAELMCVEKLDIPENGDPYVVLTTFRDFKGIFPLNYLFKNFNLASISLHYA